VHLNLTVHEVWSDEDVQHWLGNISPPRNYFFDAGYAVESRAFGVLFRLTKQRRRTRSPLSSIVAGKTTSRYDLWHEIAHASLTWSSLNWPFAARRHPGRLGSDEKITDMVAAICLF